MVIPRRALARDSWRKTWRESSSSPGYRKLAPEVTHRYMSLHFGRAKGHSALLTQLRTGKIGFNQFLCERRVPGVTTGSCDCGQGHMTVRHVLLACSRWQQERQEMLQKTRTMDIKKLLGNAGAATAAIKMVMPTKLVSQFQAVAPPSER